jgi:hypothetical protein
MSKEYDKAMAAYDKLVTAREQFSEAIMQFRGVFEPECVGLSEWEEIMDETMYEIQADIESELGENE